MTPTPGRILHVAYGDMLPGVANDLPCRVAVVSGGLIGDRVGKLGMLPVSVFTMNAAAPVIAAYVDVVNGWHDPRSCTYAWPQGDNDGERSDPTLIEHSGKLPEVAWTSNDDGDHSAFTHGDDAP